MYARANTIPKSQLPDLKLKYVEHYWHDKPKEERKWNENFIQIVSVDPASKNLAINISRKYINGMTTPVLFTKIDLTVNDTQSEYDYLLKFLESHRSLLLQTHVYCIERQLPQNYKMVRIAQHLITYIMTICLNNHLLPSIYEIDTKLKGQYLKVKKSDDVKKIGIDHAIELLTLRNDKWSLNVLNSNKKKDDLADVIIQVEALFKELNYFQIPILAIPEATTEVVKTPIITIKNKN